MRNRGEWEMQREDKAQFSIGAAMYTLASTIFIIAIASALASIDIVSPQQNSYTNSSIVTFDYFLNNYNATSCDLIVDSQILNTSTNLSESFNQFTAAIRLGAHTWKIQCNDSNSTESSEEMNITLDLTPPTIILLLPQGGQAFASGNAEISFVALDNDAGQIPCSIILNNETAQATLANNSQPTAVALSNLSDGQYFWRVQCQDYANNTQSSEERNFTIDAAQPAPQFGLAISRREFYAGEQGIITALAPGESSVRIEVCPDQNGFVECDIPLNVQNATNFPLTANLPFLNKEGKYVLEAYFSYSNYTQTKVERYNVTSGLTLNVDYPRHPRMNEPVLLAAAAGGGLGALNYTWLLSNGVSHNTKKANITYTSAGNYTNRIIVTDAYNNTRNQTIILDISSSYSITIAVRDENNGTPIREASVEIDQQSKETDTSGQATVYLRPGKRDLIVLADNYAIFSSELNITSDQTFVIPMRPLNFTRSKPIVALTYPENNATIMGVASEVGFSVQDKYQTNCSIYIAEENTDFFIYLGSTIIPANDYTEKRFEIIELDNMTYRWRVECSDDKKTTGISETRAFNVGLMPQPTVASTEAATLTNKIAELESSLSDIVNMPSDLKETVEAVGYGQKIEDTIKVMKNAVRDLDGLNFQNLNPQDLEQSKQSIMQLASLSYQTTPYTFELVAGESFVDYIENADLESIAKEYISIKYGANTTISPSKAMKLLIGLQQEAVISTKTRTLKVTSKDGSTKEVTAIIRDIKTYNITKGASIVEVIPKEVAASAAEIRSTSSFETIKDDPIISFPVSGDTRLVYYFEKAISPEQLKNIRTAVFADFSGAPAEYVTGLSITDIQLPNGNWLIIPLAIIVLSGLFIGIVRYEGLKVAQYAAYTLKRKNTLHYINVILNDINDNIQVGNIEKATSLYSEVKSAYSDLPSVAKNDIYDSIAAAARGIEAYQESMLKNDKVRGLNETMISAEQLLGSNQLMQAIQEYKRIEAIYHELDDNTRQMMHPHIVDLGNKIQIMADSNRKQSFE